MRKEPSGIYTLPCEVNGLKLRFVFDTGASYVSISLTEASFMLKNGYLEDSDIIGTTNIQNAEGGIAENYTVNLKSVKIGSIILKDIKAVVSKQLNAPLLLGQSVLDQLGHWSINNSTLILNDYSADTYTSNYTYEQLRQMIRSDQKETALNILRELIQNEDDKASQIYLSNTPEHSSQSLLADDPYINKAIRVLEDMSSKDTDEIYENYEKLIYFSLYKLYDGQKALEYFRKIESKNILSLRQCDFLAYIIMLNYGPDLKNSFDESVMNDFFMKGYYKAYTTYATYLNEQKHAPKLAFQAYKKCADKGYPNAMFNLGVCYLEAEGTIRNVQLGVDYLKKAAEQGDNQAIAELCYRYYYGIVVKQDYDKVRDYAKLFGNDGYNYLLKDTFTGIAYWGKKDYRMAKQFLERVNLLTLPGNFLTETDRAMAYNAGINFVFTDCLYAVGRIYEKGLSCKQDFNKAFEYYSKLAEFDAGWGNEALGDMFFFNESIETDAELAYSYYLLGANNDSAACHFILAFMNYHGIGTPQSYTKANEYKQSAIKLGVPASSFDF